LLPRVEDRLDSLPLLRPEKEEIVMSSNAQFWLWFWIILVVVGLGVRQGVNNLKRIYGGAARAIYNSPVAAQASKQGLLYFLHRLFR
jgi:hypothetical protein